jgi:hypothetical protein
MPLPNSRNVPDRDNGVTQRRALLASFFAGAAAPLRADSGVELQSLAPGLWRVPAQPGDADAGNRGQVTNLLVARAGGRLWLLGSGPSPAFGRRLARTLRARWGTGAVTVVSPWPQPEAVLGVAGLGDDVVHVAHADVARQMAQRCAACLERLRARLGAATSDLGDGDPVRLPTRLLHGAQGGVGPWRWWRLQRADEVTVTVWQHIASGVVAAPGLLGDGGMPDGRDADIRQLAAATALLPSLPGLAPAQGWIGEQGGLLARAAPHEAAAYWVALQQAIDAALERGDDGQTVPATLPGVAARLTTSPRHALNWQRAWRQAEDRWLHRNLR